MSATLIQTPTPSNEPVLEYRPASPERALLKRELARQSSQTVELALRIGGREVRTGELIDVRSPHSHRTLLARAHVGGPSETTAAIEAAKRAHPAWASASPATRAAVFLKAADLLRTKHRAIVNAATMLGQSKTAHQAEIDAACELIDFLRYNVHFASKIASEQPDSALGTWNQMDARPLEGFVFAATPFNFTAIAGNLPAAPALMGNTVVWKPSNLALRSAHAVMDLLDEAGLPPGVINLVMGDPEGVANTCIDHPDLAGLHFTGSTVAFQSMWARIGANIRRYRSYPRVVGETGGKDFVFAHASADPEALACALVRGAFEYQGQKCSAASRAYIPASLWPKVRPVMERLIAGIRVGDVSDFRNFMGAVIDDRAFSRVTAAIAGAKADPACSVLIEGAADRDARPDDGYFIDPTVIVTTDPKHSLMQTELFGPVLTVWVYPDAEEAEALALCDQTSPYALTGAIWARDRAFLDRASAALRFAAGNFYVNDKPTGAVVGQQPFGGARGSGTNDKAGSMLNLLRWVSPRIIKETFNPPVDIDYPSMREA